MEQIIDFLFNTVWGYIILGVAAWTICTAIFFAISVIWYKNCFKRFYDIVLSGAAILFLSPILVILIIVGAIKMKGNPFFTQLRPGKNGKIFKLIKFRSMTCEKDSDGNLLPDEMRLTRYGKLLRATSLDELPELLNIFIGNMSIVGPRPQLVRDMVFMSDEQNKRHSVTPGLTGLAQCSGRNNMSWEKKFEYDLKYIEKITFFDDLKIILMTAVKVFKRDGITEDGEATATDFGDYLLSKGEITKEEYDMLQEKATRLTRV